MTEPFDPETRPALDDLIRDHLSAVLAFVRLKADPLVRRHESCADIVQSVFREVLADEPHFEWRGPEAFRGWLFKRVMTKLVDRKRFYLRDKRDVRRLDNLSAIHGSDGIERVYASMYSPSQAAMAREDLELFECAFDELTEEQQRVIVLSRLVGLSHNEIAAEIDKSPAATRMVLSRALVRIGLRMRSLR